MTILIIKMEDGDFLVLSSNVDDYETSTKIWIVLHSQYYFLFYCHWEISFLKDFMVSFCGFEEAFPLLCWHSVNMF